MKRAPSAILAVFGLCTFILILGMWVRSHFVSDRMSWDRNAEGLTGSDLRSWQLRSGRGRVALLFLHRQSRTPSAGILSVRAPAHYTFARSTSSPQDPLPDLFSALGFTFGSGLAETPPPGVACSDSFLAAPYWALGALFAIHPFRWLRLRIAVVREDRTGS